MTDIVIASAARTPICAFGGGLSSLSAARLGAVAIRAALERARLEPEAVSEVVLGQVLTAGTGMNPARQGARAAGIPQACPAYLINQVCGSGLRSVAQAAQAIAIGDSDIVVAGGQENMSQAPHCAHLRGGAKMGDVTLIDTMLKDGLWCALMGYHMGATAENVAARFQVTRAEQDTFAAESQRKAAAAQIGGRFADEIVGVVHKTRKGELTVVADEHPRPAATVETLARLKPAFAEDGTVTAGNASGINDGAAALVLMRADEAARRAIEPLARAVSWATVGVDPALMGTSPIPASRKTLEKAGWQVDELDLIEANEAFAAKAIAVDRDMGWDPARVNVNGGAIALGHPIGASGARLLVTLLHEMGRRDAKKGLATLCIGGGMGIAKCVARD